MSKPYWIPNPVRREVSIKSDGYCFHCKKRATSVFIDRWGIPRFKDENDNAFELDHIKPLWNGGKTNIKNLVLSCRDCNRKKKRINQKNEKDIKKIIQSFNH